MVLNFPAICFDHNFDDNIEILKFEQKGHKLKLLESSEINKFKNTELLLNDQIELINSSLLKMSS